MTKLFNGNHLDLYSINSDFTGSRYFTIDQEEVEFHNATTIRIWFNEQSADFPSHWHTAMEILMPVENYYDVIVNDSSYHLLPGEILVIPPGELHELIAPNEGKRFVFLFDITLITKLKSFSGIQSLLAQPLYVTPETYPKILQRHIPVAYADVQRIFQPKRIQRTDHLLSAYQFLCQICLQSHQRRSFVSKGSIR